MYVSCLPVSLYAEFFSGCRTIPEWSRTAKALSLDAIDINALFIRDRSVEELRRLRAELSLPVLMVSAYSDFTNPSDELRALAVETAMEDIRRAQAVGARFIRLTAGQAYPGMKDSAAIQRVYDCFAKCAADARETNIQILLENHSKPGAWEYPDFNFDTARFLALWDALKQLPVSVNYDTANAYALGSWEKLLEAVKGRIATIHLNDLASVDPLVFARVGTGIVPLEEMLKAIYDTGFSGPVCIEEASFQGESGISEAVRYTRALLASRQI